MWGQSLPFQNPLVGRLRIGGENWTQTFFFSQTFRAPLGYPGKIPGYPAQKVWFPWFRGTYRTFWRPPVHVEDPYPTGKYPDQKFGFGFLFLPLDQRKTKGQQLKGKIVSALFHTFWHFSTLFHTFSEFFRIFPPGLFLRIKGFYCCFSSKIIKENKKKKTKPFCTLVVARLSSSD